MPHGRFGSCYRLNSTSRDTCLKAQGGFGDCYAVNSTTVDHCLGVE